MGGEQGLQNDKKLTLMDSCLNVFEFCKILVYHLLSNKCQLMLFRIRGTIRYQDLYSNFDFDLFDICGSFYGPLEFHSQIIGFAVRPILNIKASLIINIKVSLIIILNFGCTHRQSC